MLQRRLHFHSTIPCKKEDKAVLDKKMKRLSYLGIMKEKFSV